MVDQPSQEREWVHEPPMQAVADNPIALTDSASSEVTAHLNIAELFDEHATFLLAVVRRMTGPGPHVDDIVQEVFVTAARRMNVLSEHPQPRGWLCRTAVNLVRHHVRGEGRKRNMLDRFRRRESMRLTPAPADAGLEQQERARRVHRCLEELTIKHREVLVLHEMQDLDAREVADILEVPYNTVRSRLNHARQNFLKVWNKDEADDA